MLVPRLKAAAQPLRYLDFVIESTVRGAVVDGRGVLVSVPDPARFALHKVLIAGERPVIAQAKSEKDLRQAAAVLGALLEDREGDIALALEDAAGRGEGWRMRLARGLSALARLEPQTAEWVSRMLDAVTP